LSLPKCKAFHPFMATCWLNIDLMALTTTNHNNESMAGIPLQLVSIFYYLICLKIKRYVVHRYISRVANLLWLFESKTWWKVCVTTLFLLLLLLWTFELYLILSWSLDHISWSYLLILSWRSYLLIYDLSWSLDLIIWWWSKIRFFIWTLHLLLTCIRHAFDSCLSLTIDMHSTHVAAQHAFTLLLTCFGHTLYMCLPWGQHMDISI